MLYYIKDNLSPSDGWAWEVRLMADHYEDLAQPGFVGLVPGMRLSEDDHHNLAELIIDLYKEKLKAEEGGEAQPASSGGQTPNSS